MSEDKNWRNSREYRIWRAYIIRRDGVCVVCGSRNKREAHHLANGAHHPELRYDTDNGVTLCRTHHSLFHNKFVGSYRMKTSPDQFERFMEMVEHFRSPRRT